MKNFLTPQRGCSVIKTKYVLLAATLVLICCVFLSHTACANELTVAQSAVLMERDSGRVLYSKNMDKQLSMASTTKIMTALVVAENNDMDEVVTVDSRAVGIEGSSIYLKEGQKFTVKELLCGLMLRSGNDAAVALALHTSGSVEDFVRLMNERAENLGATNTHFANPHGLPCEDHYTTAYDLALITACALKNPTVHDIVALKKAVLDNDGNSIVIFNKNKLLNAMPDADGVKTGYTTKAGRCFVGSATRNGMQLIAVVLNCGPMFEDAESMLNWGFAQYTMTNIVPQNKPIRVIEDKNTVYYCKQAFSFPLKSDGSEDNLISKKIERSTDGVYYMNIYFDKQLIFSQKMVTI